MARERRESPTLPHQRAQRALRGRARRYRRGEAPAYERRDGRQALLLAFSPCVLIR
jgi:hypothetical protein